MATVPRERIRVVHDAPVRPERRWVLHWMTAARRLRSSPALERAAELGAELGRPVLILEALRAGYPHASDRLHAFVMAGMAENARGARGRALYHPYLEPRPGDGKGLLAALARDACAVVTDDFPAFFLPRMLAAAAPRLDVRVEAVDGSCLVPFRLAGKDFPTAYAYRRHLQRALPAWLDRLPAEDPLAGAPPPGRARLPAAILARWPAADPAGLARPARVLASLPIDHAVPPCGAGGPAAAEARLAEFVRDGLDAYAERRNAPDEDGTSRLSPWLHFGHLATFDVVRAVLRREGWTMFQGARAPPPRRQSRRGPLPAMTFQGARAPPPSRQSRRGPLPAMTFQGARAPPPSRQSRRGPLPAMSAGARGAKAGWWGLSASAEAFLDELVTWRELGFVTCAFRPDHASYGALPPWALATLARHARDRRPVVYGRAALEAGETADPLWNAAQRQLLREGRIHGYLRMLWGKKVLEWTRAPEEALEILLALNDRWALDGRDPSSVSGIFWCLGRYDRPWGPERPIFGTVRYMSSTNTARKVPVKRYLARYGPG